MKLLLAALAFALLLAPGCVKNGAEGGRQYDPDALFVLPPADASYHAVYRVEEGGTMEKEVWRAPGMMRSDLSVQGIKALSFFFVDSRAYSCTYLSSSPACYDVTPALSQADASRLAPGRKDVAGAMQVESVKIGNTEGTCYLVQLPELGSRKLCFAVGGVVAYDSYNVTKELAHTEYLASLEIYGQGEGPPDSVFALPAQPVAAPGAPAPPATEGILGGLPA